MSRGNGHGSGSLVGSDPGITLDPLCGVGPQQHGAGGTDTGHTEVGVVAAGDADDSRRRASTAAFGLQASSTITEDDIDVHDDVGLEVVDLEAMAAGSTHDLSVGRSG